MTRYGSTLSLKCLGVLTSGYVDKLEVANNWLLDRLDKHFVC